MEPLPVVDAVPPENVHGLSVAHERFQRVMAGRYEDLIEQLTGRSVVAFLSQAHVDPDITMEIFFVDGPLEGFGAVEITQPE